VLAMWQRMAFSQRHLRSFSFYLQGLDPRSIANLFSVAVRTGEKILNDEECFIGSS
jgi:hypothetical protein